MSGIISRNRGMYKNQLQELAQRSCFNLPSYTCIREGPDHAPRFKATVNFNGEIFECPTFCTTLRQAEHSAAEVALNELAKRGPSRALAARVLDESGVFKNLLQETAHRAGLNLPSYTTVRFGPGHVPAFSGKVELAGMSFTGEPARTKKQAQKNASMAAWTALKQMSQSSSSSSPPPSSTSEGNNELEHVTVARVLARFRPAEPKKSPRMNRQRGRRRPAKRSRDPKPLGGGVSLHPEQYQDWAYPHFSSGVAMYQVKQQQEASEQQNYCLTLPATPRPLTGSQNFPFIQSIFQPDQGRYFPARDQVPIPMVSRITMSDSGPSLHLSNPLRPPVQVMVAPQVTIQEIQEIRDHERLNALQEEKQRSGDSKVNTGPSVQLGGSQPERFEGASLSYMGNGYRPRAANPGHTEFRLHNPLGSEPSWSGYRPFYPSSLSSLGVAGVFGPSYPAPPNMLATSQLLSALASEPDNSNIWETLPYKPAATNICGRLSSMAPAVQIRTVVPVCAPTATATAPIQTPEFYPEGLFLGGDEGSDGGAMDVNAASLGLGKLRI